MLCAHVHILEYLRTHACESLERYVYSYLTVEKDIINRKIGGAFIHVPQTVE